MMGVWFLSSAYAFQIVGFVGQKLAIDEVATSEGVASATSTLQIYTEGFESIAYVAFGGSFNCNYTFASAYPLDGERTLIPLYYESIRFSTLFRSYHSRGNRP